MPVQGFPVAAASAAMDELEETKANEALFTPPELAQIAAHLMSGCEQ